MVTTAFGHTDAVKLLVAAHADVNAKEALSEITSLMLASSYGRADCVKLLLDHKADVNVKDNEGKTALMLVPDDHPEIADLLKKAGAKE